MTSFASVASAATLTVAADGTGDYTSLSAAISAASSGDTIYVQRGAYSESNSIKISNTNIFIKGESADKVTLNMPNLGMTIAGSGCHIENLKFLSGLNVLSITSSNCTIRNNIFENSTFGVELYSSYNLISNNLFISPSNYGGINIAKGATFNDVHDNVIIGATGYSGAAISGSSNLLENNTIRDSLSYGLSIYKTGINNTIVKNSFINNTKAGIQLYKAGSSNKIYLNTFDDNGNTVTTSGTTKPSTISWFSPDTVDYTYNGTKQSGILGNYWASSYSGTDDDSNGIGDTYYTVPDNLGNDTAPLMGIWQNGNIISPDSVEPIARFTASSFSGQAPFTVTFTGWSSGPGKVTSYLWDFGDGTTSTEQKPSHTYTKGGNYTIKLTVTCPGGSNSMEKTDFISVTGSDADLTVTSISSLYPAIQNTVTATIENKGTMDAGSFKAQFTLDGNTTSFDISGLAAGNNTTISITDQMKRKYGDSVPITITLDTENTVAESDESNNEYATPLTVTTNGDYYTGGRYYTGNDLETGSYQEGNIAVKYSQGDSGYISGGGWYSTTVKWTNTDLPIPENATVKEARLYQSYTWNYPGDPNFSLQFNGNNVNQTAFYGDGTDNFNGQAIFDVTPYFNKNSNTAVINASNLGTIGGLYGAVLVVIYEDASEPYRMIWLDEGCDTLYGGTDDYHVAYAMFNNVTIENLSSAKITTVLPSGGDNDLSTILFNGQTVPIKGSGGGDPGYKWYDVTSSLQNDTNELGVRCDGGYLNLASAILEVTKETASEANFTANTTGGDAPLAVKFTDTSTGTPANWTWDFGDGGNSTEQNPTHTYNAEGTYTVKLTVSNSLGSDSEEKIGYITVGSAVLAPVAEFSADQNTGNAPLTVQFKDESTNTPTSWIWDFGDGKTSTEQNPSHTYETAGTYTVKLTATNYGGSNTTTKTDYITVTSDVSSPVASFTTDANSGKIPFTVRFTDTSTGKVSSWKWDFGDGSTSTEQNPIHTYVTEGIYNVTLTTTGPGGSNTVTSAEPVVVSAPLTSPSYNGGIPLATVQNGTVSGGLWYDSYPGFATSAQKTFILPDYTKIKWARLYVTVYDGHMQNNYRGSVNISIDANGDSAYEIQKNETFNTSYSFPGEGGTGPVWLNDHMNRVTSDYLMWYDLTDAITGQQVNVQATTTKVDSSFDGRVKAMTLVVAYDDSDSDQVYYWVNQGHDTVNPLDETYTGSTSFGTSTLSSGWNSANLTAIYLASVDGIYALDEKTLTSGVKSGSYFGFNSWDISSLLTAGQDSALAYNKQDSNYYKIPLALMSVRYPSASPSLPDAAFAADVTSGNAPLTVNFTDQSTGTPTSWLWDFGDGTNTTEQNPSHIYTSTGTYSVSLTVSNDDGSDSEIKTDYIVVSTPETPDTTNPVIESVVLFPANTTAGSTINISVNATDDTGVTAVTAGDLQLTKTDGIWQGSITAPSSVGNYSLSINATDAAGNTAETSVPYSVVKLSGGANIAVSPRASSVTAGNTVSLNLKVKNTQNIDDTFKVRISVSELPASYQVDLSWFNWTEKTITLKAGEEVLIPVKVTVPDGAASGRKLFRANANSETSSITGFDTGYLTIS
jgi:parallel beta-helix repeat protein